MDFYLFNDVDMYVNTKHTYWACYLWSWTNMPYVQTPWGPIFTIRFYLQPDPLGDLLAAFGMMMKVVQMLMKIYTDTVQRCFLTH